jgi:CRP/FNR family transcriptional regulator, dissimilatory nitrate respiration regulator
MPSGACDVAAPPLPRERRSALEALEGCDLFSTLAPEDLEALSDIALLRRVARKARILERGAACTGFYVVAAGRVKIFRSSPDGDDQVLSVVRAGQSFAEAAVFSGTDYPASAEALEPSTLCFLPKDRFLSILSARADIPLRMLAGLSQRLRHLVNLLEDVSLADVDTRLLHYLQKLLRDGGGVAKEPSASLQLPMPKHVLALHLAMTPPTLSRAFGRLARRGLLRMGRGRLVVPDVRRFLGE